MDLAERHALTALCAELDELRAECARQPHERQRALARLEAAARARLPILALLAELLGSSLDETVRTLASGLPGAGPGQADEERFCCPDGACDRVSLTAPAGPVPRCTVTGQPMKRR
ncbi:hypothetical protein [Actinokineospora iranica]|uniref:Uncharacterized protein n=1 Tax=Actinokineospora iranica TaxID=1271860 RepID=A0A1G6VRI3_9PSEU|nr:hypothetical protein [Actinokineospora iranica]SDD55465.1 hypothetical protein SAMN05216174_11326 [Actinokineospora iranica]